MSTRPRGYVGRIVPLNLPNVLTLARIAFVPLMVMLLLRTESSGAEAAAVFGVAAITDAADGHLARARNMITTFGRLADPVADKLLVGAALLSLVAVDRLALWVACLVIAREAAVSALRWHAGSRGIVIEVTVWGKLKTVVQMTTIPLLMLVADPGATWVGAIVLTMAAVTLASGVDYGMTYLRRASEAADAGVVPAARW